MTPVKKMFTLLALCACTPIAPEIVPDKAEVDFVLFDARPADADPQSCWASLPGKETKTTVERFVEVSPARKDATGQELSPPIFRKVDEEIVSRAPERVFEQVCPRMLTPRFIGAVQRALIVRGLLESPATERLDEATRAAIKTYQSKRGLNSDMLSVAMARELGLVTIVLPKKT